MVTLELPDPAQAPNYRNYLVEGCEFRVRDLEGQWVAVAPGEGAGHTRSFFRAYRLCDAETVLSEETWAPMRENPAWEDPDIERRQRLLEHAEELGQIGTVEAAFQAVQAGLVGTVNDAPAFLEVQLPALFEQFPHGSLWLISVGDTLLARLAFLRSRYALELTPDIHLDPEELLSLRALEGHSITQGVAFDDLFKPVLLTFSPGTVGHPFAWHPHVLVFLFGMSIDLRQREPRSLQSLYPPGIVPPTEEEEPWADFWMNPEPGDVESLLAWWVTRLNILYSHATDPTRFERLGRHDAGAQYAWFLTLERLLLDAIIILAGVQDAQATRLQAAFDLLDKAEALLGYGRRGSGAGFKRLLRRSPMLARLDEAWEQLPLRLRPRFRAHGSALYSLVYEHVYEHTLTYRRTPSAVKVWNERANRLVGRPLDNYVPDIVRAVRNSSHGFLEQVKGDDRYLIATHDGCLPRPLGDLAALIMFGLVTDADRLSRGVWF
jgi:hypothetical protein